MFQTFSMIRRGGIVATFASVVALSLIAAAIALAAASDLDTTFGSGGKVLTAIGAESDHLSSIAIQPDGKIVVAGDTFDGSRYRIALVRYNADGTLDTTFDGDGKMTAAIGPANDYINAIALQPDGKIVAVGSRNIGSNPDFAVVRINTDGSLDATFDGDGVQFTPLGPSTDIAFDVALQPDGKIVVGGRSYNAGFNDTAVARYNPDGSLDTTFDSDGTLVHSIVADSDQALAMALQPDGKIVLTGPATTAGVNHFAFLRLNPNGSLDAGFDGDGLLVMPMSSGSDIPRGLIAQPDGKLLAVGEAYVGSTFDFALARLNTDGSPDAGFDGDGKVTTAIGTATDFAYDVRLQWDGKIVALGAANNGTDYDTTIARYNTDGSLDTGFDADGKLASPVGSGSDYGYALAIQPDGKYVAAGDGLVSAGNYDFAVQRFVGDPPPSPLPPPAVPTASITSPSKSKVSRKRLRRFAGTAGPAGQVAKVEIALRKIDKRALKRKRCLWLKSNKAKFVKTKAKGKKCSTPRFIAAAGTESWTYKLRRKLAKGKYKLYVRATLTNGAAHTTFTKSQGNLKSFSVR